MLGESDNEGADALKLAVSGALGLQVDYYVLVSIPGFIELVDAMGGVTVNINQPIPIGGAEGLREPEGYLDPGPDQHLNGFEALWFARGRYGLDDYDRMRRQRCLVDAVIDKVDPITLLTRYEKILGCGPAHPAHRHPRRAAAGIRRPGLRGQGCQGAQRGLCPQRRLRPRVSRLRLDAPGRGPGNG